MKKNLNIAYLNGAEGMIKRGASGGSGGGSSSGEASTIEYLDVRDVDFKDGSNGQVVYALMATYIKLYKIVNGAAGSEITFATPYALSMEYQYDGTLFNDVFIALSIDKSMMALPTGETEFVNLYDYFNSMLGNALDAIPRITKEQFYSLE